MNHTQHGKIVVASDIHYGLGKNSKNKLNILKEYVEPAILKELNGDETKSVDTTFVICGDLFHEMVSVRTDIYKEAKSFLLKCAELAHVIVLAGNHDCFDDCTDVTSVELFEQLEDISVVRFPVEKTIYGLKCLFLPWSDNNATAFDYGNETYDCVFCHPDVPKEFFSGLYILDNSRRFSATEKNKKVLDEETLLKSGLEKLDFSDGTRNDHLVTDLESVRKVISLAKKSGDVFAGHIHKHSESHIMGRTFRFIGSPYQTTSEEMGSRSGIYTITPDGVEFKDVTAPEFVRIRFSDIKKAGVDKYDFSAVTNNIVQFDGDEIITVEDETKLKRKVLDAKPYEVSETDYSNLVMETVQPEDTVKYQKAFAESPKQCLDLFIENMPDELFEKNDISREHVIKNFNALYDFVDHKNGVVITEGGAHINYRKMTATNFLSYESMEFDFEKYKGLTLVYGKNLDNIGATNACGKSNIIKALTYALFGRFPKKVKKENMVPWTNSSKDVCVTLEIESNGVSYRIESGMRGGKSSFHRVFNLDTGEDISRKQLAETRKFIENEILHCNFDMFMKTTVLTSSEIFNFYSMAKEDKDDYLNTIFGTKTIVEIRDTLKAKLKDIRATYQNDVRLLESKQHDIELNLDASEKFEANRRDNLAKMEAEINGILIKIEELKESDTDEKKALTENLRARLETLNTEIRNINSDIQKKRSEHNAASGSIAKDETTIRLMADELVKHKDVIPKLCDKCKKVVSDGYNLREYAKSIKDASANKTRNEKICETVRTEIDGLTAKRDELVRKSIALENDIRNSRTNAHEIGKLEVMVESKRSTMEFIKSQTNPNARIVKSLEADKSNLEEVVAAEMSKIRNLDFIQTRVVSQEVVINLLTSKFIKQLNERIRYYLQRLGLNLGVEFDDYFQYEFIRGNGAHPEFNSLSGGESLRIVIATSFAFKDFLESRRNISSNIRFLDEFFEKDTDNLGMNSTIAILKDFSRIMNQNVFLISNKLNELDDSVFDNILAVTIKNDRSSIGEETVKQ